MEEHDRIAPGGAPLELGTRRWGAHEVLAYHRPHLDGRESGDRLFARLTPAGALAFAVIDASGHGAAGEETWCACGDRLQAAWQELAEEGRPAAIRRFAGALNTMLMAADEAGSTSRPAHAAMCAGLLAPDGELDLVVLGYGVHPLVGTETGPWRAVAAPHIGIKLGWLATEAWAASTGAYVAHRVVGVRRLLVLTDGFLGDDFADADATLAEVRALEAACGQAETLRSAAALIVQRPHADDDATLLAVERRRRVP